MPASKISSSLSPFNAAIQALITPLIMVLESTPATIGNNAPPVAIVIAAAVVVATTPTANLTIRFPKIDRYPESSAQFAGSFTQ